MTATPKAPYNIDEHMAMNLERIAQNTAVIRRVLVWMLIIVPLILVVLGTIFGMLSVG